MRCGRPTDDPLNTLGHILPMALFVRTPVETFESPAPTGPTLSDVLKPAGPMGDRLPEGLRAIELLTDALSPAFRQGDILFIRELTTAHDGQKVIARLADGRIAARAYHAASDDDGAYLSNMDGHGPTIHDGFSVHAIIEYYLTRA